MVLRNIAFNCRKFYLLPCLFENQNEGVYGGTEYKYTKKNQEEKKPTPDLFVCLSQIYISLMTISLSFIFLNKDPVNIIINATT